MHRYKVLSSCIVGGGGKGEKKKTSKRGENAGGGHIIGVSTNSRTEGKKSKTDQNQGNRYGKKRACASREKRESKAQ